VRRHGAHPPPAVDQIPGNRPIHAPDTPDTRFTNLADTEQTMSTQTPAATKKKAPVHTTFQPHMTAPLCAVLRQIGEPFKYPASMTSRKHLFI